MNACLNQNDFDPDFVAHLFSAVHDSDIFEVILDTGCTYAITPFRSDFTSYNSGDFGSVAGKPLWKQHQHRILDESIRWIETLDQPSSRKLVVELETETEMARGER